MYWQCKASDNVESKCDYKASQPNPYITGNDLKRLKRLNLFESSMLQINDMQYLKIEEKDLVNLTSKSQWRKERSTCCEYTSHMKRFVFLLKKNFFFSHFPTRRQLQNPAQSETHRKSA